MKVEVYYNFHRDLFSVRHKGKVIRHAKYVCLSRVTFAVQPAGRKKVLEKKQKNVHAFVRGTMITYSDVSMRRMDAVSYNPYKYSSFVKTEDKTPVYKANSAYLYKPDNSKPYIFAEVV